MDFYVICILLSSTSLMSAADPNIQYIPGDLNIILSAPHGGSLRPANMPNNRSAGCQINGACVWSFTCGTPDQIRCDVVTSKDMWTKELTLLLREALKIEFDAYPSVIINNLHRIKLDANRAIDEATFGDPLAEAAWNEYQGYIQTAKNNINGRGLFLDIHGQAHEIDRAELGYMVIKKRLNGVNGLKPVAKYSSIKNTGLGLSEADFESLLRGPTSLGKFLNETGFDSVPSPHHPRPNNDPYFTGGYNTKQHGSRYGGVIDAIQIESSVSQRSSAVRATYATALAKAIKLFMNQHY